MHGSGFFMAAQKTSTLPYCSQQCTLHNPVNCWCEDCSKKPLGHSADFMCQTWSQVLSLADLAKFGFTYNFAQSLGYLQLMKVSHIFKFNRISTQGTLVSDKNLHQMHGSTVVYMHCSYNSDLLKSSSLLSFKTLYIKPWVQHLRCLSPTTTGATEEEQQQSVRTSNRTPHLSCRKNCLT